MSRPSDTKTDQLPQGPRQGHRLPFAGFASQAAHTFHKYKAFSIIIRQFLASPLGGYF